MYIQYVCGWYMYVCRSQCRTLSWSLHDEVQITYTPHTPPALHRDHLHPSHSPCSPPISPTPLTHPCSPPRSPTPLTLPLLSTEITYTPHTPLLSTQITYTPHTPPALHPNHLHPSHSPCSPPRSPTPLTLPLLSTQITYTPHTPPALHPDHLHPSHSPCSPPRSPTPLTLLLLSTQIIYTPHTPDLTSVSYFELVTQGGVNRTRIKCVGKCLGRRRWL